MDSGPYLIFLTLKPCERSHDVDLLRLREVEDFFGSGTNHFVILANGQKGLVEEKNQIITFDGTSWSDAALISSVLTL